MPFKSHMPRDTFAVELLLVGESLENVSRLLTHKSIKMTERYFARWVTERKVQLKGRLSAVMLRMGASISQQFRAHNK